MLRTRRVSKHPTSKLGRHAASTQRFCACCCQQKTSVGELSSLEGPAYGACGPPSFCVQSSYGGRRLELRCNINTTLPRRTSLIAAAAGVRPMAISACQSSELFSTDNAMFENKVVDHKGTADGGIVSPISKWTLTVRWSCAYSVPVGLNRCTSFYRDY